jgi:hypothetical protein
MQLLKRTEVINWAKCLKKYRLVKSIECVGIIGLNGQEYVTATSLQRIMQPKTFCQLTADVTSYIFN